MEVSDFISNNKVMIDGLEEELVEKTTRYVKSMEIAHDLIVREKLANIDDCEDKDCLLGFTKIWFAHKIQSIFECTGECPSLHTYLIKETSKFAGSESVDSQI